VNNPYSNGFFAYGGTQRMNTPVKSIEENLHWLRNAHTVTSVSGLLRSGPSYKSPTRKPSPPFIWHWPRETPYQPARRHTHVASL
jgi:hypothetical protein